MISFRKSLAIALTASTLGLGALATSSAPADAHGFGRHGGGHFGGRHFGGRHFGGRHFGHHWGYHWHHRFGRHYRHRHFHYRGWGHWGHRWGYGYRHFSGYRVEVETAAPRVCPVGEHLGYLGKYCWPNRD